MIKLKDEKGITLVELMAALTIFALVIGVAITVFSSINFEWNSSSQKYVNDNKTTFAMDTLTQNLVSASKIIYINNNEFRFKSEKNYKALVLNNNSLILYTFTDTTNFANTSFSYTNNTALYSKPISLADNVALATITMPTPVIQDGEVFSISITFNNRKVNVWGASSVVPVTKKATIKLLLDH